MNVIQLFIKIKKILGFKGWKKNEFFSETWIKRILEMAKYIKDNESVIDLGCGKMWLKTYGNIKNYTPVDYKNRGKGTIICDFNLNEFPEIKADIAFVSGTLEYIVDPKWFINSISQVCNKCIISYCILEENNDMKVRKQNNWMNHLNRNELIELFSNQNFELMEENSHIEANRIFVFIKRSNSE